MRRYISKLVSFDGAGFFKANSNAASQIPMQKLLVSSVHECERSRFGKGHVIRAVSKPIEAQTATRSAYLKKSLSKRPVHIDQKYVPLS